MDYANNDLENNFANLVRYYGPHARPLGVIVGYCS